MANRTYLLETIYEDENENVWEKTKSDENFLFEPFDVDRKRRLSHYICWTVIGSVFFIITLMIGFSLIESKSTTPTHFYNKIKQITYDFGDSLILNGRLRSTKKIFSILDRISTDINDQLSLPSDTIRLFSTVISTYWFDWSKVDRENKEIDGILAIYLQFSLRQFCFDDRKCRQTSENRLDEAWTQIVETFRKEKLDDRRLKDLKLLSCGPISNFTSTSFVGFLSMNNRDISLAHLRFCELFDHHYFIESILEAEQRHYHLYDLFLTENDSELGDERTNSTFCLMSESERSNFFILDGF